MRYTINSLAACSLFLLLLSACTNNDSTKTTAAMGTAGLTLPEGFGAQIVADSVGTARHIVVNDHGEIFVKLNEVKDGKGILVITDKNGDGKADSISGFADYGGTGITIKNGYLYASSNTSVFRYKLNQDQQVIDTQHPDTLIYGLIDRSQHNSKSIALDDAGHIYVNIGAYSNVCQVRDRIKGSPGMMPCPVLDSAGGIWRFSADSLHQTYGNGMRYATGLRNVVGLDWNKESNALYVMQHGRDNLHDFFPDLYDQKTGVELPSEAMYKLHEGADCGWPYIYYDQIQKKKILSPEYGGDGKKEGGEKAETPVVAFPGHLAPNALLFYTGNQFPEKYKNGAFVAFHGSWNRAPHQAGFYVAFVPFKNGVPSGDWEIFANGFAETSDPKSPGNAKYRPCGLAQGPDGSLYVSDDAHGAIFRITYAKK